VKGAEGTHVELNVGCYRDRLCSIRASINMKVVVKSSKVTASPPNRLGSTQKGRAGAARQAQIHLDFNFDEFSLPLSCFFSYHIALRRGKESDTHLSRKLLSRLQASSLLV